MAPNPPNRKKLIESSPNKPCALEVRPDGIHSELKRLNQWVCWNYEKNDKGKWTKVPINAATGRLASSTNPKSWTSFDVALRFYLLNQSNVSGIGSVLGARDGFTGVDLDDCILEDGKCLAETNAILNRFKSAYVEYSPSGTGLKMWVRGDIRPILGNGRGGSKSGNYEAYTEGKFFAVTGHVFSTCIEIPSKQSELEWFAKNYLKSGVGKKTTNFHGAWAPTCVSTLGVTEVIEKIQKSRQAEKFNILMAGGLDGYGGDHSSADMALLCILAFWCQKDSALMEAVFNCSVLADRDKWRDRSDYRQTSINTANSLTKESYSPSNQCVYVGKGVDPVSGENASDGSDPMDSVPPSEQQKTVGFPVDVFPLPLQRLVKETSRVLGCTPDAVGTILLGFASIGVGNTRRALLRASWTEPPILYVAVIGWPGEAKSPIMNILGAPVYRRQSKLRDEHNQKMVEYERDKELYETSKKSGSAVVSPLKPTFPHLITTDATGEKLADMLNANNRGVGLVMDELSALMGGMDQYKSGGKGRERQFFLSAWSGVPSKIDRKSDGGIPIIVDTPYAPIMGGIQPDMLGSLKDHKGREDGWIHRLLFCYPPARCPPEWGCPDLDVKARESWNKCFEKLATLSLRLDDDGLLKPYLCRFTTQAEKVWKPWYDNMLSSMKTMEMQYKGPAHKLISYAARLSLLIQLLRWASEEPNASDEWIDEVSVRSGTRLADYFLGQLQMVYERLDDLPEDKRSNELLAWVRKKAIDGKVTVRQVANSGPRWARKKSEATKGLLDLQDRGYGSFDGKCLTLLGVGNV